MSGPMADRRVDHLLIGGFAAGHSAAELRKRGVEGSILLVGREPHPPYERPLLSKEYLRAGASAEDAYVNAGAGWDEERDVELLTDTSGLPLDTEARTAQLHITEHVACG